MAVLPRQCAPSRLFCPICSPCRWDRRKEGNTKRPPVRLTDLLYRISLSFAEPSERLLKPVRATRRRPIRACGETNPPVDKIEQTAPFRLISIGGFQLVFLAQGTITFSERGFDAPIAKTFGEIRGKSLPKNFDLIPENQNL